MLTKAKQPFRFYTRLGLTLTTGAKASNLAELLEGIRTLPDSVIYQHTHRFLQEHQYLVPEPANDYAVWVTEMLQDEKLGEKLASIDTVQYSSFKDLRQALVSALEDCLKKGGTLRSAPEGEEFHFMRSIRLSLPTSHLAWDLAEFAEALRKVSISSLYLHVFEARLRSSEGMNDFSRWFVQELGEEALAKKTARLDPYAYTLEGLREKMLKMLEERIREDSRG